MCALTGIQTGDLHFDLHFVGQPQPSEPRRSGLNCTFLSLVFKAPLQTTSVTFPGVRFTSLFPSCARIRRAGPPHSRVAEKLLRVSSKTLIPSQFTFKSFIHLNLIWYKEFVVLFCPDVRDLCPNAACCSPGRRTSLLALGEAHPQTARLETSETVC